jgi:uncharacterized membrane protein YidH (DUF202 family)
MSKSSRDTLDLPAWNLRLALENTFLNYCRNGIISTVAGVATVQYYHDTHKHATTQSDAHVLAPAGLFGMGFVFFTGGTVHYSFHAWRMKTHLRLGPAYALWVGGLSAACWGAWALSTLHFTRHLRDIGIDLENKIPRWAMAR